MASQNPTRVVKHIVVFGESGVGKTCFADMFTHGEHYVNYDPTLEDRMCRKLLDVNGVTYALDLMDLNASHYREGDPALSAFIFEHWLQEADGVVLLYDITSPSSFDLITDEGYINVFLNRKATRDDGKQYVCQKQRFGCVLVGTKIDLAQVDGAKVNRESLVSKDKAEQWAMSQGKKAFELATRDAQAVEDVMVALVRDIIEMERRDDEDIKREERRKMTEATLGKGEKKKRQSLFGGLKNKLSMKGSSSETQG